MDFGKQLSLGRDADIFSSMHSFRSKESKKTADTPGAPTVKVPYELPPVALPTSGKGSKQLLPLSPQAPLSFALLWHRSTGLSRPFLGRRGLTSGKRRHILASQGSSRKRAERRVYSLDLT